VVELPSEAVLWSGTGDHPRFAGDQLVAVQSSEVLRVDLKTATATLPEPSYRLVGWCPAGALLLGDGKSSWAVDVATGARVEAWRPAPPVGLPTWADDTVTDASGVTVGIGRATATCGSLKVWVQGQGMRTLTIPSDCDVPPWFQAGGGVIAADTARGLEAWNVVAGTGPLRIPSPEGGWYRSIAAASPDGATLVVAFARDPKPGAAEASRLEIWSTARNARVRSLELPRTGLSALTVVAGRAYFGWRDGTVEMLDLAATSTVASIATQASGIQHIAASADGTRLAIQEADLSIAIWDAPPR
jgi:hypothetical protein